jgi:parallel beta-helix repeat protein
VLYPTTEEIPLISNKNKLESSLFITTDVPIVIDGNTEFATLANLNGWNGDGTKNNPYIIANYSINTIGNSPGIDFSNINNYFILKNVTVSSSTNTHLGAFHFRNVSNGYVLNSTAINSNNGFILSSSQLCVLANNTALNNSFDGFVIESSSNNSLINNLASNNGNYGFYIDTSNNNILKSNIALNNSDYGFFLLWLTNNVLKNNIAISNMFFGFSLVSSHNNLLFNNSAINNSYDGFFLDTSNNNTLVYNIALNHSLYGISIPFSEGNVLNNNVASFNRFDGIYFYLSSNSTLSGNIASNNSNSGITLNFSENFTLKDNILSDNGLYGISLQNARYNSIYNNNLTNNSGFGINVDSLSERNSLFKNQFNENNNGESQAYDNGTLNKWTNGTHGNYWSDYIGIDSDNDRLGDSSYILAGDKEAIDPHPLINPIYSNLKTNKTSSNYLTTLSINTTESTTSLGWSKVLFIASLIFMISARKKKQNKLKKDKNNR